MLSVSLKPKGIAISGLYGVNGGVFSPSIVFTAMSLMDMVRGPLITISTTLNAILVDGKTAVDRVSKFLVGWTLLATIVLSRETLNFVCSETEHGGLE